MNNLIKNELIKWLRRPSFYVMSAILVGLSVLSVIFTLLMGPNMMDDKLSAGTQADWKEVIQQENEYLKMSVEAETNRDTSYFKRQLAINEYRLQNSIEPSQETNVWSYIDSNLGLSSVITLFVVIIAAGMIASEFTWGTIKLLMIRPIKRSKILLAKYFSVLIFMVIFFAIFFLASFVTGAIAFGFDNTPSLAYINGEVMELSPILYVLLKMFLSALGVIMFATIAFMISSVFRNNSLAIGISLFLLFTGTQITSLLGMKYEWAKFSPFANIHFESFLEGMPVVAGTTFWFSVIMFLVYFIILHVISFMTFIKRDIAA